MSKYDDLINELRGEEAKRQAAMLRYAEECNSFLNKLASDLEGLDPDSDTMEALVEALLEESDFVEDWEMSPDYGTNPLDQYEEEIHLAYKAITPSYAIYVNIDDDVENGTL